MSADRVPFPPEKVWVMTFAEQTAAIIERSANPPAGKYTPACKVLMLLDDCQQLDWKEEHQGATYKTLAYIAHLVGMSPDERRAWYEVCRWSGLTQRHAGHIVGRLKRPHQPPPELPENVLNLGEYRRKKEARR